MVHPPLPRANGDASLVQPAVRLGRTQRPRHRAFFFLRELSGDRVVELIYRQGPGLCAANLAMMMMFWGLGRPALWLDEAASQVATQRSWPHLWALLQGTDAPLVPYYLLLKAEAGLGLRLFGTSASTSGLEILLRWPSAIAVAVAVWVMVSWLCSAASPLVAIASGSVLLLTEGVSRYGQEARPYALVLLLAIITTALWWRLMKTASIAAIVGYGVGVVVLVGLHAMAVTLVLAHLVAVFLVRRDDLLLRLVAYLCGALTGLLVVSPLTFSAIADGGGASRFQGLSGRHLLDAFLSLFVGNLHPNLGCLILFVLAGLGLLHWNSSRYGDLTRVAASWALIPLLLIVAATMLRENLLLARYVLFVLPGWAILAGLGLTLIAERIGEMLLGESLSAAVAARWTVAALGVGAIAIGQWPTLVPIRASDGHGDSVVPILSRIDRQPYRSLPLVITPQLRALEFAAYAPGEVSRLINVRTQTDQVDIWPIPVPRPAVREHLQWTAGLILNAT